VRRRRWLLLWPGNVVTLSRFLIVTALGGGFLLDARPGRVLTASALLVGYWLSDLLDGYLARRSGTISTFGATLDVLIDRYCDLLLSLCVLSVNPGSRATVIVFLLVRIPGASLEGCLGSEEDGPPRSPGVISSFLRWGHFHRGSLTFGFHLVRTLFFMTSLAGWPDSLFALLLVLASGAYGLYVLAELTVLARRSCEERTGRSSTFD